MYEPPTPPLPPGSTTFLGFRNMPQWFNNFSKKLPRTTHYINMNAFTLWEWKTGFDHLLIEQRKYA